MWLNDPQGKQGEEEIVSMVLGKLQMSELFTLNSTGAHSHHKKVTNLICCCLGGRNYVAFCKVSGTNTVYNIIKLYSCYNAKHADTYGYIWIEGIIGQFFVNDGCLGNRKWIDNVIENRYQQCMNIFIKHRKLH